jgi:hypothetical protein
MWVKKFRDIVTYEIFFILEDNVESFFDNYENPQNLLFIGEFEDEE